MSDSGQFDGLELTPSMSAAFSKLRRLSRMSISELAGRGRQEAAKRIDRLTTPGVPAIGAATAGRFVRETAAGRFFAGVERQMPAADFWQAFPSECRETVEIANAICQRRFNLLGHEGLVLDQPIDWHRDVIANVRAPRVHWTELDLVNYDVIGDGKVTFEINRHQWIVTLAQAYWLTGDSRFATEAATQLRDWIRENPYGVGLNWASSLEVSYRLVAWCWALTILRQSSALSDGDLADVLAVMMRHASHVRRYLSTYFSPNTHLTGEALGLFYAGVLLKEFPGADRCREVGQRVLVEETERQILADGVYFEQTTCYQRYTIDIYLHFLILADRNGIALPPAVRDRVERMVEALIVLHHPDRSMPQVGDSDGGWVLPLVRRAASDCRGTFAVAATYFSRPDFAWAAAGPAPEVAWIFGADGVRRFAALKPAPPVGSASRVLESGGYAVMRSSWADDARQMIVDVGPLGCPYSGGHGHADLLSVQCHAFGEAYLVDPGTYCYVPEPEWRSHFRSSAAHSTLDIDGRGQAESRGPFGWNARPAASLKAWRSTADVDYLDASHDAYVSGPAPVQHRRRVLFIKPEYWVIVDDLVGEGRHRLDLRFQFAPRPVESGPGLWMSAKGQGGTGLWLSPFADIDLEVSVRTGESQPIAGWVSADYGRRQPAPMVTYSAMSAMPVRIVTLVLPTAHVDTPPVVDVLRDAAGRMTGVHLRDRGETVLVDDDDVRVARMQPAGV